MISTLISSIGIHASIDQMEEQLLPIWPFQNNTEVPSIRHILVFSLLKKNHPVLFMVSK